MFAIQQCIQLWYHVGLCCGHQVEVVLSLPWVEREGFWRHLYPHEFDELVVVT